MHFFLYTKLIKKKKISFFMTHNQNKINAFFWLLQNKMSMKYKKNTTFLIYCLIQQIIVRI